MAKTKSIKDTVHGYIELEEPFWMLVDTPEFQRLKWIEQTSYRILYPSARHDRFIHSLGVYHLGKIAFDSFLNNVEKSITSEKFKSTFDEEKLLCLKNTFLFSCLFHDIGHAPFSHTLEELYNYGYSIRNKDNVINSQLLSEIKGSKRFTSKEIQDFDTDYQFILSSSTDSSGMSILTLPKVHEIVSSTLILKQFDSFELDKEFKDTLCLDLCIRAIMGCTYRVKQNAQEKHKLELGLKNGIIRLLNSNTIDVDKLDYITRDTIMSGYENTSIDTMRLLKSLTFINKDGVFYPAFNKSALSIIDNVIKAKNAQAKWIISHPSVKYEEYLLKKIIKVLSSKFIEKYCPFKDSIDNCDKPLCPHEQCNLQAQCKNYKCKMSHKDNFIRKLFSLEALTQDGVTILGQKFCLLSDTDIISLMKEFIDDININEYFARNKRYKPIWKSPEEFIHLFKKEDFNIMEDVALFFKALFLVYLEEDDLSKNIIANKELLIRITDDMTKGKKGLEKPYKTLKFLEKFCDDNNVEFEFVLIPAKNSFSTKISEESTYFLFNNEQNSYSKYSDLFLREREASSLSNFEFIYIYSRQQVNRDAFVEQLYNEFNVGFSYT